MACGGSQAVRAVLESPELLEHILAQLPIPDIRLGNWVTDLNGKRHPLEKGNGDRLAACWVNKAFRKAALRLPWRLELKRRIEANDEAVAGLCRPRNLQALTLFAEGGSCPSAVLLSYATSLTSLEVRCAREDLLWDWLLETHVPPRDGDAGQAIPVLDWLSAQSSLETLSVACSVWSDASWLHHVTQLKHLELEEYAGPPLLGQPNLETLYVQHNEVQRGSALDQWGSPCLTALDMVGGQLYLGPSTPSGHPACCSGAPDTVPLLRGLQCLTLENCLIYRNSSGLRELLPCLTYLSLEHLDPLAISSQDYGLHGVLASGLPLSLVALRLELYASDFPPHAVSALAALVKLESLDLHVWDGTLEVGEVQAIIQALSSLPKLTLVCFQDSLARSAKQHEAEVGEGLRGLEALLVSRGGGLIR